MSKKHWYWYFYIIYPFYILYHNIDIAYKYYKIGKLTIETRILKKQHKILQEERKK